MRGPSRSAAADASGSGATPAFVYAPELGEVGAEITLSEAESHYVARVCRVRAGERVTASDGRGCTGSLRVVVAGARVRALVESVESSPRPRRGWVLSGAPEASRDDWEVEKLAELGVERWIPIDCDRGEWTGRSRRLERWERLATMAMKQSRSAHRLEVVPPVALVPALRDLPAEAMRWLASEGGGDADLGAGEGIWIGAIGPAAGFTPREVALFADHGFRPVRLAARRLRTETAAIVLAALLGLPAGP